ncbi:MAG: outer membrane beta-barrel protein [Elusimicrobiaceae bacterium]|nr:outer membrane beta-barrel protein [Elusimicrobiaceae bacterium]MBP5617095.1 outer membrane beta-barrel protein [Elusimicrobiaceae bacterium]
MKKASVLLLLVALVAAMPVAAEKPLHFTASETVSYDDNIYLTDKNTKDSFISTTRLGAEYKANVPSTGLMLSAEAGVGYNAYTEKHNKNNYWDALGGFALENDQFKLGDRVLYTSDPANSSLTERHKRLNNTGYISYVTSREKMFGVGLFASDSYDRYFESEMQYLNRNRVNLGAQLHYNMTAKTSFFVEYMYSDIDYRDYVRVNGINSNVKNSHGHRLGLGVNGQLAAKVTGTAKVTYDMRQYEHSLAGAHDYNDLVGYYVALQWEPTSRNVLRLSGERKMEETFFGIPGEYNRYFADTVVSLYGAQKLTDKFTASLTLAWENMDYSKRVDNTKRDDNLYVVRPELDYQFKDWLSAGVWYQFRTRHSNWRTADYDSNKAGVFVKAVF